MILRNKVNDKMSNKKNNNEEIMDNKELVEIDKIEQDIEKISEKAVEEEKKDIILKDKEDSVSIYKDKNKRIRLIIIIALAVILAFVILFSVITCINKLNSKVYKNIHLFGADISGMTKEAIEELLSNENSKIKNEKISAYQGTEEIVTISSDEIAFSIDEAETLKEVMGYGRSGNIFKDNFDILKALIKPVDIEANYKYDKEKLDGVIKNIDLTIKDRAVDDNYNIDEEHKKLVITRGKTGNAIDYDKEEDKILENLKSLSDQKLNLDMIQRAPKKLDVQKVYSEVKREAKDAYVDENEKPIKFVAEVVGLDFDAKELENILNKEENKEEGKVIEFELKVTEPNVKLADITSKYYNDKLSGKTTYFNAGQTARANNLKIALDYLNGKIIMPGETFSYNAVIGDTTAAKGYMAAATFKGGTVVNEMGGGICQTTSTLYDAVLMANLEIVERHNHGLPVGYIQPSLDATVYSPVLDFKFKNTRNYPVKIVTSFSYGGSMNVSIYGTKEDNEYDITLSSATISTIPYTTKYVYDSSLPNGAQVIDVNGVNGYVSEGYITKMQNGQVISSSLLSRDTYNAQQQVVRVGTGNSAS